MDRLKLPYFQEKSAIPVPFGMTLPWQEMPFGAISVGCSVAFRISTRRAARPKRTDNSRGR